MNEEIKTILSTLNVPFGHLSFKGNNEQYIVWSHGNEEPLFSCDDEVKYSQIEVYIDINSKTNYLSLVSSIKKIFKKYGYTWINTSGELYEEDTKLYSRTITFIKERKVDE